MPGKNARLSAAVVSPDTEPHPRRFRFGKSSLLQATNAFADAPDVTLRDADLTGFVCRKRKHKWTLGIERKLHGKVHRVAITEFHPDLKPGHISDARQQAQDIMSAISKGAYVSPSQKAAQTEREIELASLTLHNAPNFHSRHNPHVRQSTIANYRHVAKRLFPTDLLMSDLDADRVRSAYHEMLKSSSPAYAASALRGVRALWHSWADAHPEGEEPQHNPVTRLTKKRGAVKPTPPREGALSPPERRLWWAAAERLSMIGGPTATTVRALQSLFLTGCRRNEILHLRWDEVDSGTFTIPAERMKAGRKLDKPITPEIQRILDIQSGLSEEWVFPSRTGSGPVGEPRKTLQKINSEAGQGIRITPHDLRRTYISTAIAAGVPDVAVKLLVGHAISDITESYARALRNQLPEFSQTIEKALIS